MLGFTGTLGTKRIGRMFPYRPLLVSSLRTTWLKKVPLAWPLLSFQPWLLHWTDPSRRIGVCARSGHYVITWTKPKISVQARNWFLFPLGRVSRRILSLLPFPPGSNKPSSFVTRCQTNRLNNCIRFGLMTFAASKAFQGGVPLDQILAACHWKSHNTFTQFYLKDLAWADSDVYHLGPVVAAQQIRD